MPSLLPIGGAIRLNASAGGAATVVPLAEGGFAAVYRVANGPDVFRLFDDNFQPITDEIPVTTEDFMAPQATALSDGQFVVAWLDDDQTIQASIYNPDGSLAVGPVVLANPTDPTVGLSTPKIVGNAFGGFTAIWQDNATINGVTGEVFIQSYDSDGNLVGDPITVVPPTVSATDQATISDFRIAVLGDGTTVVAAQVVTDGVELIMYSVNGGPLVTLAGGDPNYLYTNPQITPLASGGYVITYDFVNPNLVGQDSPDANWTTGGSVFTSHGTRHDFAIGTTVTTTQDGTFAVDPSVITPLADGGFVVTFEPLTSPLGDGYLVDAQQFDGFGNTVGPVVLVAPQGFLPSVATSADGVVLDTYQFGSGVYLQPFSSAPTPFGPEPEGTSFGLNSVVSANSPGVAPLSTGGFVVVYEDANGNSWAQIYDYNRNPVGSAFQIASPGTQPVVASQTNGTFLVAWSNGSQILGAMYDNQGDQLSGPFSMSGAPSALRVLAPAINSLADGGFSMAYETDLADGSGSHLVTMQQFDANGNAIGASVSQTFAPTNPLAPPKIAALEGELFGSVTVMGVGDAIVAALVSDPPTGGGSALVAGQQSANAGQPITVASLASASPTISTVQVSGGSDGATRADVQVTTIGDGNIVVAWDEAASGAEVWQIVGQVMTPAGVFVGNQFVIGTALPSNAAAAQIALSALPDGGFLITYDSGNTSLASQRFDASGNEIGPPVVMTGSGQGDVVTTLLSNGTLVLLSDNSPAGGGTVTGQTFSVPPIPMNWTGGSGTSLGTGANWDVQAPPDSGHIMQFGLTNGGTLTGAATAAAASFTGGGPWVLSDATVNVAQGLTDQSALQISGGTLIASGPASIGVAGGASLTVSGGAQVSVTSTAIGASSAQTGTLTLTGTGTSLTDTGPVGAGGFQAGDSTDFQPGHGIISVTLGASLSGSDTDLLGVTAGSEGDLSITSGGTVSDAGLVVGAAGTGVATVNGGTISDTGSLVLGRDGTGQGALTVTGTTSAVTISGGMIVGDAGFGQLSISQGGTVNAASLDEAAAAGGSGIISVTGTHSAINVSGLTGIGDFGPATVSILNGGTFQAQNVNLGVGSSTGAITIGGTGTDFNITNDMTVGHNGVFSVGTGVTVFIADNFVEIGAVNLGDGAVIDPLTAVNSSPHGGGGGSGVTAAELDHQQQHLLRRWAGQRIVRPDNVVADRGGRAGNRSRAEPRRARRSGTERRQRDSDPVGHVHGSERDPDAGDQRGGKWGGSGDRRFPGTDRRVRRRRHDRRGHHGGGGFRAQRLCDLGREHGGRRDRRDAGVRECGARGHRVRDAGRAGGSDRLLRGRYRHRDHPRPRAGGIHPSRRSRVHRTWRRHGRGHLGRPPQDRLHAASEPDRRLAGAGVRRCVRPRHAGHRPAAVAGPRGVRERGADPDPPAGQRPLRAAGTDGADFVSSHRAGAARRAAGERHAGGVVSGHRRPGPVQQWRRGDRAASRLLGARLGDARVRAAGANGPDPDGRAQAVGGRDHPSRPARPAHPSAGRQPARDDLAEVRGPR